MKGRRRHGGRRAGRGTRRHYCLGVGPYAVFDQRVGRRVVERCTGVATFENAPARDVVTFYGTFRSDDPLPAPPPKPTPEEEAYAAEALAVFESMRGLRASANEAVMGTTWPASTPTADAGRAGE